MKSKVTMSSEQNSFTYFLWHCVVVVSLIRIMPFLMSWIRHSDATSWVCIIVLHVQSAGILCSHLLGQHFHSVNIIQNFKTWRMKCYNHNLGFSTEEWNATIITWGSALTGLEYMVLGWMNKKFYILIVMGQVGRSWVMLW